MSSWATIAVEDLQGKIKSVSAIKNKNIYVHSQDRLLDFEKKVNTPCVGIIYTGMAVKNPEGSKGVGHETAIDVSCSIAMLGGEVCDAGVGTLKQTSTEIMDAIRNAVITTEGVNELRWRFLSELPLQLRYQDGTTLFGYVQRWATTMIQGES